MSFDIIRTNLSAQLTSFIGREREITQVKQLLMTTRLLTLTGAGGCGKTRFALQVATELRTDFTDGVWFIDLAPLTDPSLIPQTIASIFELREGGSLPSINPLKDYLRTKQLLLLLDNCEHLIQACAELCDTLLHTCPDVKILATSREVLNIAGETFFRVPSLALPDHDQFPPLETLGQFEAIQLFVERAKNVDPQFQLTNTNKFAVAQICQRLDGIPLAIELAAARMKTLSAEQIAARLDNRFQLLTSGSRVVPSRQQTLRATIDWSYDLLSEPERALLRRLSVFVGGWTLEAAEAIARDNDSHDASNVLDLLTRLADKSLIIIQHRDDAARYQILETIREYAHEKLVELGGLNSARDRHLNYFVEFGKRAEEKLKDWDEQLAWFRYVDTELPNIRAALNHGLEVNLDLVVQMIWSIQLYWWNSTIELTYIDRLIRALPQIEKWDSPKRARMIRWAGNALTKIDLDQCRALLSKSFEIALSTEDPVEIALAYLRKGESLLRAHDLEGARDLLEKSGALFREVGDKWFLGWTLGQLAWAVAPSERVYARKLLEEGFTIAQKLNERVLLAYILNNLGDFERLEGNYRQSVEYFEKALQAREGMVHRGSGKGQALAMLAHALLSAGDYERAKQVAFEGLNYVRDRGAFSIIFPLYVFPRLLLANQKYEQATRLFSAVDTLTDLVYARGNWIAADYDEFNRDVAEVRAHLDPQVFDEAWNEGRTMTIEQAVAFAIHETAEKSDPSQYPAGLTAREVDVLRLLVIGLTNPEIAKKLVLSERTVHAHLRSIYSKLDVTTRSAATRVALENKIV